MSERNALDVLRRQLETESSLRQIEIERLYALLEARKKASVMSQN